MKLSKLTLSLLLLLLSFGLWADYYDGVINLSGQPLLNGLRTLISTNTNSSYDDSKTYLFQTADNVGGTVTCIYTGEVYNINSSYNGQSNPNTEHTYAQSWFTSSESSRKKADIHHLFVSTMQVNSSRGNLPFDVVSNHASADIYYTDTPWQSWRGSNSQNNEVFEPATVSKGNIARALLYFYTRYNDTLYQQGVNMINTLVTWHNADPPNATDVLRNQRVQSFQGNRNPYVDHPEFVQRIWGPVANDDLIQNASPTLRIDNIYPNPFKENLNVTIDAKNEDTVQAKIYNLKGQAIYTHTMPAGTKTMSWNGITTSGDKAPAGVYFIRLSTTEQDVTAKVLLVQ